MSRLNVPLFCSLLMASNPNAMPRRGPRKPINTAKEGNAPSDNVNSFKKRKVSSVAPDFTASPILLNRSEEHTSELQSRPHLVCRLLLEKKKKKTYKHKHAN